MARISFGFGTLSYGGTHSAVRIVIPKKVARTAVARNRIRRRIRHAIREAMSAQTKPVTVYPNAASAQAPYAVLVRRLAEVLRAR